MNARAEQQARELSAELLSAANVTRSPRVTVLELLARYEDQVTRHKKPTLASEDRRRADLWQHLIGELEARAIDFPPLDRFVRERRGGNIVLPGKDGQPRTLSRRPSEKTIGADIIYLNTVLNWATRVMLPDHTRLLGENRIRGYERPKKQKSQATSRYLRSVPR